MFIIRNACAEHGANPNAVVRHDRCGQRVHRFEHRGGRSPKLGCGSLDARTGRLSRLDAHPHRSEQHAQPVGRGSHLDEYRDAFGHDARFDRIHNHGERGRRADRHDLERLRRLERGKHLDRRADGVMQLGTRRQLCRDPERASHSDRYDELDHTSRRARQRDQLDCAVWDAPLDRHASLDQPGKHVRTDDHSGRAGGCPRPGAHRAGRLHELRHTGDLSAGTTDLLALGGCRPWPGGELDLPGRRAAHL
jgi:hypothetical protein